MDVGRSPLRVVTNDNRKKKQHAKWNEYMKNYYHKKVGANFGKSKYTVKYTKEDEDFIMNNKGNMTNKEIGIKLNVSAHSIKDKMIRMGICRNKKEIRNVKILFNKNIRKYPKYTMKKENWREMVNMGNGERILKSHYILLGKPAPKGFVVHHKDMNPKNNSKDNLVLISKANHNKLHTSNNGIYGQLKMNGGVTWA